MSHSSLTCLRHWLCWRTRPDKAKTLIHAKTITFAFLLSCLSSLSAYAANEGPSIILVANEHVVNLGKKEREAIRTYDPGFQVRKQANYLPSLVKMYSFSDHQAPFAVIGDFNGDGSKDVVLQGYDKSNELLIAVLSSNQGPHVIEIKKSPVVDVKSDGYGMEAHKADVR